MNDTLPTLPAPLNETLETQTEERQLTLKQRKWLDVYLQTGNATEAAMQVYDCKDRNSASVIGTENLAKLSYLDFLEEAGLTDKLLLDKLKEGLESKRFIPRKGKIAALPDYAVRHKYVETGLKLKRRLVERQEIEETNTVNINVNAFLMKVYGGTTTKPTGTT